VIPFLQKPFLSTIASLWGIELTELFLYQSCENLLSKTQERFGYFCDMAYPPSKIGLTANFKINALNLPGFK